MRARILVILPLLVSTYAWPAQKSSPSTVNEAASLIVSGLSSSDRAFVRQTPKSDLIIYHRGWGAGIRNVLGLWKENRALLEDCGGADVSPDSCSMIIIEAVWKKLMERKASKSMFKQLAEFASAGAAFVVAVRRIPSSVRNY